MSMNYTGYQPPRPPKKHPWGKIVGFGCGGFLAMMILIGGCAAIFSDVDTRPKTNKKTASTAPASKPPAISTNPITKACEKAVYGLLETGMKTGKTPSVRPGACEGLTDAQWTAVIDAQGKKVADTLPVAPEGPLTTFGPGTYLVGEDIAAGSYKTKGPEQDASIAMCFWSRKKDDSGSFDSIIANEIVKGQGRVTIKKGEFFETSECQDWVKVK